MSSVGDTDESPGRAEVSLWTIAREWTRLGCIGFGGPPAHIHLLRRLCVEDRRWIGAVEFEDGMAATNLLPGPASTQLAIYCAWRVRGAVGAILGGICFIVPGLALVLLASAVFLARHPPEWILGAAAGAGAAVPAVALHAARGLVPASWRRIGTSRGQRTRWFAYFLAGGLTAATAGSYLVIVLLACGVSEVAVRRQARRAPPGSARVALGAVAGHPVVLGGLAALCWVALKVGALSYGGGFVIVPLMQHDAVTTYHWMTGAQFLNAVALGQVTPGPVVLTVAVVGYAARGVGGGLLAAVVAFAPSFLFVLFGAPHFDRIRENLGIQSFLTGAGPSVIGAIAGSAVPLGLAIQHLWQVPLLAGAMLWLLLARRGVVSGLLIAGGIGVVLAVAGGPV
ncbi:MAG: chromate efflux transporter [Acidimicrobiales bacterium]